MVSQIFLGPLNAIIRTAEISLELQEASGAVNFAFQDRKEVKKRFVTKLLLWKCSWVTITEHPFSLCLCLTRFLLRLKIIHSYLGINIISYVEMKFHVSGTFSIDVTTSFIKFIQRNIVVYVL